MTAPSIDGLDLVAANNTVHGVAHDVSAADGALVIDGRRPDTVVDGTLVKVMAWYDNEWASRIR